MAVTLSRYKALGFHWQILEIFKSEFLFSVLNPYQFFIRFNKKKLHYNNAETIIKLTIFSQFYLHKNVYEVKN